MVVRIGRYTISKYYLLYYFVAASFVAIIKYHIQFDVCDSAATKILQLIKVNNI